MKFISFNQIVILFLFVIIVFGDISKIFRKLKVEFYKLKNKASSKKK